MLVKLFLELFTFKSFYTAFVIAIVFYGDLHLFGPVTPRHILTAMMFVICLVKDFHIKPNSIIRLYLLFIFSFLISSFATGYEMNGLSFLVSSYLVSIVAFWATKILVTRYNGQRFFINLFIVLGVFDGVMTICQTLGIGLADRLMQILHLYSAEEFMVELNEKRAEDLEYLDSMDDISDMSSYPVGGLSLMMRVIPGAFRSGVANGFFLMTTGVMSLMLMVRKFNLIRVIPWLICALGCFCVQERGPILILVALSFYALYKFMFSRHVKKNNISIAITIVTLFVVMRYVYYFVSNVGSRFAEIGLEDKGREAIYGDALDYYFNNPLLGGFFRFVDNYPHPPHNLILNAFIYGGFFGGLAILTVLYKQFKAIVKILWRKVNNLNGIRFIVALAYTAFTLNSLLHNQSIVLGNVIVWMLWSAFFFDAELTYNNSRCKTKRLR